jgi:hypothetical protein
MRVANFLTAIINEWYSGKSYDIENSAVPGPSELSSCPVMTAPRPSLGTGWGWALVAAEMLPVADRVFGQNCRVGFFGALFCIVHCLAMDGVPATSIRELTRSPRRLHSGSRRPARSSVNLVS